MQVIITMAGQSSRFYQAGFKKPKYELILHERSMLEWALLSLNQWFDDYPFYFIAPQHSAPFIQQASKRLQIRHAQIIELTEKTSGQAATTLKASAAIEKSKPILIYNIDTYVNEGALNPISINPDLDGWIPVFSAQGNHWSFVTMNERLQITEIKEKVPISSWATIGLYYFSSLFLFEEAYQHTYLNHPNTETYIAPMYQYLIDHHHRVEGAIIRTEDLIPLGTPDEALAFDAQFFKVNHHE